MKVLVQVYETKQMFFPEEKVTKNIKVGRPCLILGLIWKIFDFPLFFNILQKKWGEAGWEQGKEFYTQEERGGEKISSGRDRKGYGARQKGEPQFVRKENPRFRVMVFWKRGNFLIWQI